MLQRHVYTVYGIGCWIIHIFGFCSAYFGTQIVLTKICTLHKSCIQKKHILLANVLKSACCKYNAHVKCIQITIDGVEWHVTAHITDIRLSTSDTAMGQN